MVQVEDTENTLNSTNGTYPQNYTQSISSPPDDDEADSEEIFEESTTEEEPEDPVETGEAHEDEETT